MGFLHAPRDPREHAQQRRYLLQRSADRFPDELQSCSQCVFKPAANRDTDWNQSGILKHYSLAAFQVFDQQFLPRIYPSDEAAAKGDCRKRVLHDQAASASALLQLYWQRVHLIANVM